MLKEKADQKPVSQEETCLKFSVAEGIFKVILVTQNVEMQYGWIIYHSRVERTQCDPSITQRLAELKS